MSALNQSTFLRILKGSPLPTLLALWQGGAMDRKEIMNSTGLGKSAIDNALPLLIDMELVKRSNYREWMVTDDGKTAVTNYLCHAESLIIGTSNNPQAVDNSAESPVIGTSEDFNEFSKSLETGLSENDLESYPQAESPVIGTSQAESPVIGTSQAESPVIGTSQALSSSSRSTNNNKNIKTTTTTKPLDPAILAACDEVGIYGHKRTALATDPFVVKRGADYIRRHCAEAAVRLAIWRMGEHWEAPAPRQELHEQAIPEHLKGIIHS